RGERPWTHSRRRSHGVTVADISGAARRGRKRHHDTCASASTAFDGDLALVRVHDMPHHAQANAGASDLRIYRAAAAVERLEDVRQIGGVDANPAVRHHHPKAAAIEIREYLNLSARWAVLDGVPDHILDRGSQRIGIAGDGRQAALGPNGNDDAAFA